MRKKLKNRFFQTFLTLIFLTANAGLCEQTRNAVMPSPIAKFAFAMGGVVLSALIIFLGLSVYKKFFGITKNWNVSDTNILKTPKTTQEAIQFFIHKNKLT